MATDDLWGDLPRAVKQPTPTSILLEQASLLTAKTDGDIEASVLKFGDESTFKATLRLSSPKLGRFSIDLFTIQYGIGLYPVILLSQVDGLPNRKSDNMEQFKEALRTAFISEQIRNILSRMLTQIASIE